MNSGKTSIEEIAAGNGISRTDRFTLWFSQYYLFLFIFLLFTYVGTPLLAPVLMKAGLQGPAKIIYTLYSPLCHQLAFRSWFLFGAQPFYPRQLAANDSYQSYEEFTNQESINLIAARNFLGNDEMGFKMALCERDMAIYGALLSFALLFLISGRRFKPLPWYLWVLLGMVPIGIDGLSQLPALASDLLPFFPIIRESTPFLRTLTGGMFGFFTGWYVFPLIEESMRDTKQFVNAKISARNARDNN